MRRLRIWLQLILGWLPMWAMYSTLMASAHDVPLVSAAIIGARAIGVAALLGLAVQRLTERFPWPRPLRAGFVALHLLTAVLYALLWIGLATAFEAVIHGHREVSHLAFPFHSFLVTGIWLYVMVAGVSYATGATERAARAEALAARSQLSALRAQLNPHFLFNALHTVVQLIPREPRGAVQAAEQLADLLRTTTLEDRDLVSVKEECAFVQRYLDLERLRFGDRLRVSVQIPEAAEGTLIPSFALQTLVENAVLHGAAPKVEPTDITIVGELTLGMLTLRVHDTGAGTDAAQAGSRAGTGLARLRERLLVLHGGGARLDLASRPGEGFTATLTIPRTEPDA